MTVRPHNGDRLIRGQDKTKQTKDRAVSNTRAKHKTCNNLHRIEAGLSITNDISGDKQSKITRHECDRMLSISHRRTGRQPRCR